MNISTRQYAQSLFEATSGQNEAAVSAALKNFVLILSRDHVLTKAPEIIACLQEIWDQANGELKAEVAVARPLG